jgi:eukaryotic-like serine/threonine-protein kinase
MYEENQRPARVGQPAPDFDLPSICAPYDDGEGGAASTRAEARKPELETGRARLSDFAGHWLILLFYPRDFTFVCPTELSAFSSQVEEFRSRDCSVLAVSTDPVELHREWLDTPTALGGIGPLRFPLASDEDGAVARAYGVFVEKGAMAGRGLFLVDPDGMLQYTVVHNLSVGRSTAETLRVLDALRTHGLCPSNWVLGDGIIDPAMKLLPGTIVGGYRIVEKLGEGGFAQVFAAWDTRLQRQVALKILRPGSRSDVGAMLAEARAAAGFGQHPNVCTIYAVEVHDGLPVIAMEFLKGRPLSRRLREGPLPRGDVRRVAGQIASGMAVAHAHGVIHGDLKPANVMLVDGGGVKVLDFGVSRSSTGSPEPDESCSTARAIPAVVQITPGYSAPEQFHGTCTTASDVYMLGILIYEMSTGKKAIPRGTVKEVVQIVKHLDGRDLAAEVEPALRDLLGRCLDQRPEERPTMAEVAWCLGARTSAQAAPSNLAQPSEEPNA